MGLNSREFRRSSLAVLAASGACRAMPRAAKRCDRRENGERHRPKICAIGKRPNAPPEKRCGARWRHRNNFQVRRSEDPMALKTRSIPRQIVYLTLALGLLLLSLDALARWHF